MGHIDFKIISISDIERSHRGSSFGDDLSVYHGRGAEDVFGLHSGTSFTFCAYSYLLVVRGCAVLTIDQVEYEVEPQTLLSQSPLHNVRFSRVSDDFEFRVMAVTVKMIDSLPQVNIKPRIVEGTRTHTRPVAALTKDEVQVIEECFDSIARQVERTSHKYHRELVENAICRFYLEYDNIVWQRAETQGAQASSPRQKEIADRFVELVSRHFIEHRDVTFYSSELNITPQYLNRAVRTQTGISPAILIAEITYAEARNLLAQGDMSVQQVAERLGFSDQSAFGKFFKRSAGVAPSMFSRSAKG